jgi:hypothetical protein
LRQAYLFLAKRLAVGGTGVMLVRRAISDMIQTTSAPAKKALKTAPVRSQLRSIPEAENARPRAKAPPIIIAPRFYRPTSRGWAKKYALSMPPVPIGSMST